MSLQQAEREYSDEVTGMSTIPRLFAETVDRNADRPAQRYKGGIYDRSLAGPVIDPAPDGEFASITYAEMDDVVRRLAAGFRELGVDAGARVAIFSDTRMEWAQSDFALLGAGAVVTTIYEGSSTQQVEYLLDDPDADGVVVESQDHLERVLSVTEDLDLDFVVSMDDLDPEYHDREDEGIYTLADVYEIGDAAFDPEAYESWLDEPAVDDLATLIYTSGTTGQPKGVKLTHRNLRANVNQTYRRYAPRPDKDADLPTLTPETDTVSFLPLAHVYERTVGHFLMFAVGATIAYAESADTLKDDFQTIQPTA